MSGSTIKAKATLAQRVALFLSTPLGMFFFSGMATLLVATTIDVADEVPWSAMGPGLTFDECFNIDVGVYLVDSMLAAGSSVFHPQTQIEIYQNRSYNPDHPPLGRLAFGITNALYRYSTGGDGTAGYSINAARLASALEYGILILICGMTTRLWFGRRAALFCLLTLLLMPRLFAHAHLASLETMTCLTYVTFVLVLASRWHGKHRLRGRDGLLPGVFLGLVFLTKIHAILLVPVVILWAAWNWRLLSILPLLTLFVAAFVVFLIGWPWLWITPIEHLQEYFGRATERASLNCYYLGVKYADHAVPWHYPFVMFAVTIPLGVLLAGLMALSKRTGDENSRHALFDRRLQLVLGAMLVPLCVFAMPGVTVYDGVRLFLPAFPLFAIFAALGLQRIYSALERRNGSLIANLFVAIVFAGPAFNMVNLAPCQMSYYSEAVGGLWKANDLGFETTYWGDSVTSELLESAAKDIPQGATLEVAPVLHPLQLHFMEQSSWLKKRPDIRLRAYDHNRDDLSPYVVVIRRKADPWGSLTPLPIGTQTLDVEKKQGVTLAEIVKLPESLQ